MDTQRVPYQPGVLLGWVQLSVGVPKIGNLRNDDGYDYDNATNFNIIG